MDQEEVSLIKWVGEPSKIEVMTSVRYSCYVYKKGSGCRWVVSHALARGNKKYYISMIKPSSNDQCEYQQVGDVFTGSEYCIKVDVEYASQRTWHVEYIEVIYLGI